MSREVVDPTCGHLWSRHIDGSLCPPDQDEVDREWVRRSLKITNADQALAGPAEPSEDDDPADFVVRAQSYADEDDPNTYKREVRYLRPDLY